MASLSLRISIPEKNATKMMQFDPNTSVSDTCRIIRSKLTEVNSMDQHADYGLFLADEDIKKGVWLESERSLDYYILRNGDLLEYKKKLRTLRVRMLDGMLKTLLVDDSQPVANLMVVICTKIGITNHDEYSLVREVIEEEFDNQKPGNFGTLTLKKKKEEKNDRDAKMDQLRKKLKTDDEVNWIDPNKTLREQGIDETETVLLRRKFFFSDQNIDSRDPVQLSLLYVQARDAIIDGTHPVIQDQACIFAGIQCQIQFGDYKDDKHKPGFLDLKEFLPQSYIKIKGIEKKIFHEHKKHNGLSELDAKVLYTKTARSLNTYGVTFFLVKEKMKGKNKLVPRLLGVTKDSVLRLDEKTKEILKTWPLTTVRRWGASPNTFTLDFGDYSDQYYSVQTSEAEQILQLISGYIDIILKKQKAKDHFGIEGDEGSTMVEDSVSPLKATIMQHETGDLVKGSIDSVSVAIPAVIRTGVDGIRMYGTGFVAGAQYTTISGQVNIAHAPTRVQQPKVSSVLSEPRRALISTIISGQEIIQIAETELAHKADVPELGNDVASLRWIEQTIDTHKQNIGSQIAAMNAATAQVVTLTSGTIDDVDHTAIGAAITTITSNLPEMTKGVRMIAALLDDESSGERLLNAARKLCSAFSDLLKATEPESREPRQYLLNAVSRVGEASHQVLTTIGEEDSESRDFQDILLSLAKAVANTTAALVLKAKNIAAICEDPMVQNKVISAATHCALATSQLVACAKVVGPTLNSTACQAQLMNAVREVTRAVENLVKVCNDICNDGDLLKELSTAAADVTKSLDGLLKHIKQTTRIDTTKESIQEGAVETILVATNRLFASSGDAGEMVRQARIVGQATAQLIQTIKGDAEKQTDSEQQKKLLAAAKILADATAKMVEAARQCASSPQDAVMQNKLRQAVEELREATTAAATPALRRTLICRLEKCAKQAASTATQCVAATAGVGLHNTNNATQAELNIECRSMVQHIPNLVSGVKGTISQPDNPTTQLNLINASEQFLQPGLAVVKAAKALLPTITDHAFSLQLNNSSQQLGSALTDLRSAVNRAKEVFAGLELDAAEELINNLRDELKELRTAIGISVLKPLPGETAETTSLKLSSVSKRVGFVMAQLLSATKQGNDNYTGNAAREISVALKDLVSAVRGVAATIVQKESQSIVDTAEDVINKSLNLIKEVRWALETPNDADNHLNLSVFAKEISHFLNNCVSCLPGQRDIDEAISNIENSSQVLEQDDHPSSNKNFRHLQNDLVTAASNLNDATTKILSSIQSPLELAKCSQRFTACFNDLIKLGIEMAGQMTIEKRSQIIISLKNISASCTEFLFSVKSAAADPCGPNTKNQLSAASRVVTDSINYLLDVCTSSAPGQVECDNSIRKIHSMLPLLENPTEAISDSSYFECLETVMENSKSLGDGMTGIANYAKKSEHELFSTAIKEVSLSVCGLIEAAAQAAYLAGVSDPTSVAGKPGLVDQAHFLRAAHSIQISCQSLGNPTSSQPQILSAATIIAKHTSSLCNACRLASSKTSNPVAKRQFVQSAKDVANSTAILVKDIKTLDANYSEINRLKCIDAAKPLLEAVDNLCTFASSPEFISQPAKISSAARSTQEPIILAGKSIITSSCAMIQAAKSLAISPKDPPTWQLLASHSKNVSDSIKALVASIRDKAPGQMECDSAIQKLTIKIRDLDRSSLNAVSQTLSAFRENTIQGFIDQMDNSACELHDRLEFLRSAAKYEAENIGHAISQIVFYCESLIDGGIGSASHMVQSKQQMLLLDQTKTVAEAALQLMFVTKESSGNPKAVNLHKEVDDSIKSTKESLRDLQNTFETISTSNGIVTGLIDTITRSMVKLEDSNLPLSENIESFVNYQTRMVETVKEIARLAQDISTRVNTDTTMLGPLVIEISHKYSHLAEDALKASAATSNADVSLKLRRGVQELGKACANIVRVANICQVMSNDVHNYQEIFHYNKTVSEKVSQVLAALQAGSRGTQACINAASTVSGIIGDLDTTIMFATAGTLHADNENETFADHRENILKTAKALVEDTKTLVAGAASSQEQLAVAAQNAVSTIVQLAEVVKFGAASLGCNNPEAQVMLINAVRDVTSALGDLIHATKAASGKNINDPSMAHLKDSAKVMVTNVTSLLKTVKAVEDEHTRGTRALESTIEAIGQEIRTLSSSENPKNDITPEDLIRCTKSITLSTAKTVAAGNSCKQNDIIAAVNLGRRSISDMLLICKAATQTCGETLDIKQRILQAGHDIALNYRELLQIILQISTKSNECKHLLLPISQKIAQSVTEVVAIAEILRGNKWTDLDDQTIVAESELLGAAASIDAAAQKLASLQPRKNIQETKEDMNFDEMILEAAKSIATATSALIKAASIAQKELITSGKVSRSPLTSSDDGQWSEGLISAARMVAAATHSLVESANSLVQGFSSEEKLISSAKQVAGSTAQLLVACKVKADPDSENTKRLQIAGNAVKRATDNLVRAAQQAIQHEEERSLILNRRIVGGIAQEINARSEVLRIERELEEARGRLTAIRQAKYRNRDILNVDSNQNNSDIFKSDIKQENSTLKYFTSHSTEQLQNIMQDFDNEKNYKENAVSSETVDSTKIKLDKMEKNEEINFATIEDLYKAKDYLFSIENSGAEIMNTNYPHQLRIIEKKDEELMTVIENKNDYDESVEAICPKNFSKNTESEKSTGSPANATNNCEIKEKYSDVPKSWLSDSARLLHNDIHDKNCEELFEIFTNNTENSNIQDYRSIETAEKVFHSSEMKCEFIKNDSDDTPLHRDSRSVQEFRNEKSYQKLSQQSTLQKIIEKKEISNTVSNQQIYNNRSLHF